MDDCEDYEAPGSSLYCISRDWGWFFGHPLEERRLLPQWIRYGQSVVMKWKDREGGDKEASHILTLL